MKAIDDLIGALAKQEGTREMENPYHGKSKEAVIRRMNLRKYLLKMIRMRPDVLLVGEAPGYKGCAITGIPFTSERVLASNSFFRGQDFECLNRADKLASEISATILWGILDTCREKPLLWNMYPFHPHLPGNRQSNRTPGREELKSGVEYLQKLLRIFPVKKIIALGRKAESMLLELDLCPVYVRHPANAGKRQFEKGIKIILI